MARNSQTTERRRATSSSGANPALIPGLIALVLIGGAVAVAVMTRKPKVVVEDTTPKLTPFGDMPPEALPPPRAKRPGSDLPPAPESVTSEPLWLSAKVTAAEGLALYEAAMTAKAKGDAALATSKGIAAREKLDEAVTATVDWEEMLLSKYNPYDRNVAKIKDTRTDWFNKLRYLEKSVGH